MYFYIIDPQKINAKAFERAQTQLHSSLSEYRVNGEIGRVTSVRTIAQMVETAFQRGVKTLAAVGSDETLQEVINCVKNRDITIAYIPLANSELARILGVTSVDLAARAIANRLTEQLDLGTVNGQWFFTGLTFGGPSEQGGGLLNSFKKTFNLPELEIKFLADGKYSGGFKAVAGAVLNARDNNGGDKNLANPTDSFLDLMLVPNQGGLSWLRHKKDLESGFYENIPGCSVVHLKRLEITGPQGLELKSGSKVLALTPAIIEILPKAVKMIVGRDRTF